MTNRLGGIAREAAIQLGLSVVVAVLVPPLMVGTLELTGGFYPLIFIIPIVAVVALWSKRWRIPALVGLTVWVVTVVIMVQQFSRAMGN